MTPSLVAGRFEIVSLAGKGGMGSVYRAEDRATGETVALKILEQESDAERFDREARALAALAHPSIVRYVAHGRSEDRRYLALEWLEGEDLDARIARGPLTIEETVRVGLRIGSALAEAHRQGIVHRDVKPSNIFLRGGEVERAVLLDFGVVQTSAKLTKTMAPIGTASYMAPEQARGERVGPAADVFSLGAVLFECATGRVAFDGDSYAAVLARIILEPAPRLSDFVAHAALDKAIDAMLAKEPEERPTDVVALLEAMTADDAEPRRATELTTAEQRWFSIALATFSGDAPLDAIERAREAIAPFSAKAAQLPDASVIVALSSDASIEASDQATRAARCALALHRSLPEARIAVATGRGVHGGRWPVGDVLDGAFALVHGKTAGPPLIDETTTAFLASTAFDTSGGVLRGEREPTALTRLLLGKPTPTVGRDSEIAMLSALVDACVDEQAASVATIVGAAGIGKSRVRHEVVRAMQSRHGFRVWVGRCDTTSAGSPFALLQSMLRNAFGISRTDERARAALTDTIAALSLSDDDRDRITVFLGELLALPFDDTNRMQLRIARDDRTLMGDQVKRAFGDFVHAAATEPLAIVLEDAHWGDAPSFALVSQALLRCTELPLFVLLTTRPELQSSALAAHSPRVVELGPLSPRAASALARAVLPAVDAASIDSIVERAQGNAFFLEELVRAVAMGDALPETIMAMAQGRIERLPPDARRVLRAASIFGKVFWREGVDALLGGSAREWVDVLVEKEIAEARPNERFPASGPLVFRNAILRDATYSTLTDADRTLGHKLAGEWLERVGETDALMLAAHFENGAALEDAAPWYRVAAEYSLEGHDFTSAIGHAQRAIDLGLSGSDAAAAHLIVAEAERWRGDFAACLRAAEAAASKCAIDTPRYFRAIDEMVIASQRVGQFGRALEVVTVIKEPADDEAAAAYVVAMCAAARVVFHAGDYAKAEELLEGIDALSVRRAGVVGMRTQAEIDRLRGASARHRGNVADDLRYYEASWRGFESAGDLRNACNAEVSLAFACIEVGDLEGAHVHLDSAEEDAKRMALAPVVTRVRQNRGLLFLALGDVDGALRELGHVIEESRAQSNVRFEGWTLIYASNAQLAKGDLDAAADAASKAVMLCADTPPARAGALAALARAQGDVKIAREAESVVDSLGGIEEFESLVRLAVAEVLAKRNDPLAREAALRAEARILVRAEQLPAHLKQSFRERVPENALTIALARRLG